jgi:hypothetical protein
MNALEEAVKRMQPSGGPPEQGYMRIDGAATSVQRAEAVARFQNEDICRVALLSLKAAGVCPCCPLFRGRYPGRL